MRLSPPIRRLKRNGGAAIFSSSSSSSSSENRSLWKGTSEIGTQRCRRQVPLNWNTNDCSNCISLSTGNTKRSKNQINKNKKDAAAIQRIETKILPQFNYDWITFKNSSFFFVCVLNQKRIWKPFSEGNEII